MTDSTTAIIRELCKIIGVESRYFVGNIQLLPLMANLANKYAKVINSDFYHHKNALLLEIESLHPQTWCKDGIMYCETPYGQFSFHYFDMGENFGLNCISSHGREWDGSIGRQMNAETYIFEHLS